MKESSVPVEPGLSCVAWSSVRESIGACKNEIAEQPITFPCILARSILVTNHALKPIHTRQPPNSTSKRNIPTWSSRISSPVLIFSHPSTSISYTPYQLPRSGTHASYSSPFLSSPPTPTLPCSPPTLAQSARATAGSDSASSNGGGASQRSSTSHPPLLAPVSAPSSREPPMLLL
jgi:hypothetical protein